MTKRKGRMPMVAGQHPAVVFLDARINERRLSAQGICDQAGLGRGTISRWRTEGHSPSVGNLEAVLNVLGFRLAVARLTPERSEGVEAVVPLEAAE